MSRLAVILLVLCSLTSTGSAAKAPTPEDTRYPLRARCALNLIEISQRIQLYAAGRDGVLPSKLSDLFTDASTEALRCLICPGAKPGFVEGGFYPSYAYVNIAPGGRKLDPDLDPEKKELLVFDAETFHQKGRNVLFTNMTMKYLEESEFQTRLAIEKGRWEKKDKTVEVIRQDLIPLTEEQRQALDPERPSFFGSVHFRIALAIVLAIGAVLALLAVGSRKLKRQANEDTENS